MEKTHVDAQFTGLVSRTWSPDEVNALIASIWETPDATEAEQRLVSETENWNEGTSWNYTHGHYPMPAQRASKPRVRRRKRAITFLPIVAYLRGEIA
jgi:hypothetical protein